MSAAAGLDHFVQFYEGDSSLIDSLSDFVRDGLDAGETCVVVARGPHRLRLDERLRAEGLDLQNLRARGLYVSLDAAETLEGFLVGGELEPARFNELLGGVLDRASGGGRGVRVFGDMVSVLCGEGRHAAAVRLEELWNELLAERPCKLFCAYPLSDFAAAGHGDDLGEVCARHARVVPAESYMALDGHEARLREVAILQQKARALEAEVAERRRAEASLRAVKEELEQQVEDLRRLHEMSAGLTKTLDVETVLSEVLRAALSAQGSDMGLLSLCGPDSDGLDVGVQSGFSAEFLSEIGRVPAGSGACGACYERRARVVVEDVETDPLFEPYREAARRAGFRACHSTPLITRRGQIIGVLSAHFRHPRRPSERETRLMDLYAQMAADTIEHARLHREVQRESEERGRLLARAQAARAKAEEANRFKDEFLATVSHELRTPLTAIIGWTHMLRHGQLDEETAARALQTVERNACAQAQLVDDILDVSRVITGKLRLDLGIVDLAAVVSAAVDAVQLAAEAKNIRLEAATDGVDLRVAGDAGRLRQVVWNLLSNAIKFTPPGGCVRLLLDRRGDEALLSVEDTGAGITPEFLPFVFERFSQADRRTTREHGGLGLGLAIVRHIVELHGGTASVASDGPGRGTAFTIRLPVAKA